MKRRDVIKGVAATTVAAALASCTKASDDGAASDRDSEHEVEFLFVQNAIAVTLSEGVLTLQGITPDTLYFSDRPDRIVGRVSTREFVDHWSKGKDSFEANPPNAVLSTLQHKIPQDIVVELREPRLGGGALIYDVEILEGVAEIESGGCALFIDVIGRPLSPLSVAGVARRARRRNY